MSNYFIDTHVFLWSLNEPSKLSVAITDILKDTTNAIYVSAAVAWEVAIKRAKGTLKVEGDVLYHLYEQSFQPLSITHQHAKTLEGIPRIHNDPFDRIMIAQAISDNLTLITHDRTILKYPDVQLLKAQRENCQRQSPPSSFLAGHSFLKAFHDLLPVGEDDVFVF